MSENIKIKDLKKDTIKSKDGDKQIELIDILHSVTFEIPGISKDNK